MTSTSGLAWKIAGRVGDSPIIGAGHYTDQDVGSAGTTGNGEENIRVVGAHTIVENMRRGMSPLEAGMDKSPDFTDIQQQIGSCQRGPALGDLSVLDRVLDLNLWGRDRDRTVERSPGFEFLHQQLRISIADPFQLELEPHRIEQ